MGGNRPRHHRACADHGASADFQARQDDRACAQGRAFFDHCAVKFLWPLLAARPRVVCESYIRPDKYIVADIDPIPNLNTTLHGDTIADGNIVLDENMIANIAIFSDLRVRQNVSKRPNSSVSSDCGAFDQRVLMLEKIAQTCSDLSF